MYIRFKNEDGTCSSSLVCSQNNTSSQRYLAIGSDSGVASIYSNQPGAGGSGDNSSRWYTHKSILNLSTEITSMALHMNNELLAIASNKVSYLCSLIVSSGYLTVYTFV